MKLLINIKNIVHDPQKNKLIFDGYPRSLSQAENLNLILSETNQKIDLIFFLILVRIR